MTDQIVSSKSDMIKKFLNEKQDPKIVEQVLGKVSEITTNNEDILYIAVQQKNPVVNLAPKSVILTNKRFIIYKPGLLGKIEFDDYIWRDLQDTEIKEGFRGASIIMKTVNNRIFSVGHLPKVQCRKLYSLAQEKEEEMREERRTRELEDKRAQSGGIHLGSLSQTASNQEQEQESESESKSDPVKKLKQLKEMMDMGLITVDEYESKKNEILSKM